MNKKSVFILILCLIIGSLIIINKDLFHYEKIFVYHRTFSEIDHKGDYILSVDEIVLKPGTYQIIIEGNFNVKKCGYFLIDSSEEKIVSSDFSQGNTNQQEFSIIGSAKQLRFGVSWDPAANELTVDRFTILSDHVLYKESLLKHIILSGFTIIIGIMLLLRFCFPDRYKKLFPNLSKPKNERMLIMILFLTLLTSIPFFRSDIYINGDDFYYHMHHLKGIAASVREGHIPPRILLDWLENYGYGSGFYYPNIFLIFPGILIICGFHEIAAYEIFVTCCTFCALLTMFLTVRAISQSEKIAHMATILYAFAAYRLIDIYYRAALGEIQTFIFLPLIVYGLYEIFNKREDHWWIFGFGFTGLLCCHVISVAIAGFFTALWSIIHIKRIITDRKVFFAMLKAVFLTLGLGVWFILPMIEQSLTNELKINLILSSPELTPFGVVSEPKSIFSYFYDWIHPKAQGPYPGWAFLILLIFRILILRNQKDPLLIFADKLNAYSIPSLIMCTSLFPWKIFLQFLFRIQFSWRIMMIATVLLSISCGIYAAYLIKKIMPDMSPAVSLIPVLILSIVSGCPIMVESITNRAYSMDYYYYVQRTNSLSGSEYLPVNLDREVVEKTRDHVVSDDPSFQMLSFLRKGLSVTWDYSVDHESMDTIMQVPLIYYTGYRAYLTEPDNLTYEIPISKNDIGLVTVSNNGISEGTICVRYVKTAAQHIGDSISLLTLIGCIYAIIRKRYNLF